MPAFPQISDEMFALIRSHVRDKRGEDVIAAVRNEMSLMGQGGGCSSYPTLDKDGKSLRMRREEAAGVEEEASVEADEPVLAESA